MMVLGRFLLMFFFIRLIFPAAVARAEVGFGESAAGLETALTIESLPPAKLTPTSPFYFLKTLWEQGRLVLTTRPESKVTLAIALAQARLAEAAAVAGAGRLGMVEKLFKNREALLTLAVAEISRVARDEAVRETLVALLQGELPRGNQLMERLLATASAGNQARLENLAGWLATMVGELEASLAAKEPPLATPSAEAVASVESSESVSASESAKAVPTPSPVEPSFWERLGLFLFGSSGGLLSPLALPPSK